MRAKERQRKRERNRKHEREREREEEEETERLCVCQEDREGGREGGRRERAGRVRGAPVEGILLRSRV